MSALIFGAAIRPPVCVFCGAGQLAPEVNTCWECQKAIVDKETHIRIDVIGRCIKHHIKAIDELAQERTDLRITLGS